MIHDEFPVGPLIVFENAWFGEKFLGKTKNINIYVEKFTLLFYFLCELYNVAKRF